MLSLTPLIRVLMLSSWALKGARAHYFLTQASSRNEKVGRILSIEDFGAIPDSAALWTFEEFEDGEELLNVEDRIHLEVFNTGSAMNNTVAFNLALKEAQPGDTVLVPDGKSFTLFGGVLANEKHNITIDMAGSTHFVHDKDIWPYNNIPKSYAFAKDNSYFDPGITVFNSTSITMTSSSESRARVEVDYHKNMVYLVDAKKYPGGIVNGNGKGWWDDAISGRLPGGLAEARPRLIHIMESEDVLVENLTLLNSPYWSITVEAVHAEVREINVLIDRRYQAYLLLERSNTPEIKRHLEGLNGLDGLDIPFPIDDLPDWVFSKFHQPQDLNTDGIDPYGRDIWIHNCIIQNADDSVAVKPSHSGRPANSKMPDCTMNITIENMVLTGFGASVGSVTPWASRPCVDNVVFRNISMPGTGKGIYIKSDNNDCHNKSGQITNILYEDVHILNPFWWPIWIGPQQQHEPNTKLGLKCPLTWPLPGSTRCPTPGCVDIENITLRHIHIYEPVISPVVIMANASDPIKNLVIENLWVTESKRKPWLGKWPFHEKKYPWHGRIKCINAEGTYNNSIPAPGCLTPQ